MYIGLRAKYPLFLS